MPVADERPHKYMYHLFYVHSYRTMMQECGRHVSAKFQLATFGDDTTKSTRVFPRTG